MALWIMCLKLACPRDPSVPKKKPAVCVRSAWQPVETFILNLDLDAVISMYHR
jgi:hypothetical protein